MKKREIAQRVLGVTLVVVMFSLAFGMPILCLGFLGLGPAHVHPHTGPWPISAFQLWTLNALCGVALGAAFAPRRWFVAGSCGLLYGLLVTGTFLAYFSWRERAGFFEIIIPLAVSVVVTMKVHDAWRKRLDRPGRVEGAG